MDCGWSGRVADLKAAESRTRTAVPQRKASSGNSRLEEIEQHAIRGTCPKAIRKDVQQLIGMIRQLQKQVQILETVSRAGAMGRLASGNDTAVF